MKLLTDREIEALVVGDNPSIRNVKSCAEGWFSYYSPIQPSSIDLHIGQIRLPEISKNDARGGLNNPLKEYVLKPGHTVVIESYEDFHLPPDITGICFPPFHISRRGILMIDPGHIDPGYQGTVHCTVINMGREAFPLIEGREIVTVVLFKLDAPPKSDYAERIKSRKPSYSSDDGLDSLSRDFMNIDKRARVIAESAVRRATLWSTVGVPIVVAILSIVGTYFTTVKNLTERIIGLEKQSVITDLDKKISDINEKVEKLEAQSKNNSDGQNNASSDFNNLAPTNDTRMTVDK